MMIWNNKKVASSLIYPALSSAVNLMLLSRLCQSQKKRTKTRSFMMRGTEMLMRLYRAVNFSCHRCHWDSLWSCRECFKPGLLWRLTASLLPTGAVWVNFPDSAFVWSLNVKTQIKNWIIIKFCRFIRLCFMISIDRLYISWRTVGRSMFTGGVVITLQLF